MDRSQPVAVQNQEFGDHNELEIFGERDQSPAKITDVGAWASVCALQKHIRSYADFRRVTAEGASNKGRGSDRS